MGRITTKQIAALDVLDWLYFNQILVFSAYSEKDQEWLTQIVKCVNESIARVGMTGLKKECLKHYVLCHLEIFLSDDDFIDKYKAKGICTNIELPTGTDKDTSYKLQEHNKNFFGAYLLAVSKLFHGAFLSTAFEIASDLQERFFDAPASVRYRLVERCLAYEFKNSSLDFFTWMLELKIIKCSKYKQNNRSTFPSDQVITRVGLLCEFEILRGLMIRNSGSPESAANIMYKNKDKDCPNDIAKQLNYDNYKFNELNISLEKKKTNIMFNIDKRWESEDITDFFIQVSIYCHRPRIWQGTLASWPGTLGGFIVEMQKSHTKKAIYIESNNDVTITNDVSTFFHEKGFSISGRTLYERHKHFIKKIKNKILLYYITLNQVNAVPPAAEVDAPYYSTIMLSNRLD